MAGFLLVGKFFIHCLRWVSLGPFFCKLFCGLGYRIQKFLALIYNSHIFDAIFLIAFIRNTFGSSFGREYLSDSSSLKFFHRLTSNYSGFCVEDLRLKFRLRSSPIDYVLSFIWVWFLLFLFYKEISHPFRNFVHGLRVVSIDEGKWKKVGMDDVLYQVRELMYQIYISQSYFLEQLSDLTFKNILFTLVLLL